MGDSISRNFIFALIKTQGGIFFLKPIVHEVEVLLTQLMAIYS